MEFIKKQKGRLVLLTIIITVAVFVLCLAQPAPAATSAEVNAAATRSAIFKDTSGKLVGGDVTDESGVAHFSQEAAKTQYGDDIIWITDSTGFKAFVDAGSAGKTAVLGSDVTLKYTSDASNNMGGAIISTATFLGTLRGNGYTVNVDGGIGGQLPENPTRFPTDIQFNTDTHGNSYGLHGYLCAYNQGEMSDFVLNYTSHHTQVAIYADGKYEKSDEGINGIRTWDDRQYSEAAGIVAGGNSGTLSNIRLNIGGNFTFIKKKGNAATIYDNTGMVGGLVGAFSSTSPSTSATISNCTVDLNTGYAVTVKSNGRTYTLPTDNSACAAVAGGIVGNMSRTNGGTKISDCAIIGGGDVKALTCNYRKAEQNKSYAGGAIGAAVATEELACWEDGKMSADQITGLISGWTGARVDSYGNGTGVKGSNQAQISKTIHGMLFDCMGNDSDFTTSIKNVVVLYNYKALLEANGEDTSYTIDSAKRMKTDKYNLWSEVYPTNDGGTIKVEFDKGGTYNARIEILSEGFNDFKSGESIDMSITTQTKNFDMNESSVGKFIWSGYVNKNGIETADYIKPGNFRGAMIFRMNTADYGVYNFTFGEQAGYTLAGVKEAQTKDFDGKALEMPRLHLIRRTDHGVVTEPEPADVAKYGLEVSRDGVNAASERDRSIPGQYEVRAAATLGSDNIKVAYADEINRVVARSNSQTRYIYMIKKATLKPNGEAPSSQWGHSAEFDMSVIDANTAGKLAGCLDAYSHSVGGTESEKVDIVDDVHDTIHYTAKASTGRNGANYVINGYMKDSLGNYVSVATSAAYNVKIDNEEPELKSVSYYEYDESQAGGKGDRLNEADVLGQWRKHPVLVEIELSDSGSGIKTATRTTDGGHDSNIDIVTTDGGATATVTFVHSGGNVVISYIDALTNSASAAYELKVDTIEPNFVTMGKVTNDGKASLMVNVSVLGICGAELQYCVINNFADMSDAERQAAVASAVWQTYGEVTSTTYTLDLVYNMDSALVLCRLSSELYGMVYGSDITSGNVDDKMGCDAIDGWVASDDAANGKTALWTVSYKVATVYLTTGNLFNGGTALSDVADLSAMFAKTYDGNTNGNVTLTAKLYEGMTTGLLGGARIVYVNPNDKMRIPDGEFKVVLYYETAHAGDVTLYIKVGGGDAFNAKFEIVFTDGADGLPALAVNTRIDKYELALSSDILGSSYKFGDEVPTTYTVTTPLGERLVFDIESRATTGAGVGTYPVTLGGADGYTDYNITHSPLSISITPRPINVSYRLDDGTSGATQLGYDGKKHIITAKYVDVDGVEKEAAVGYYTEKGCQTPWTKDGVIIDYMLDNGTYFVKLSIEDVNYSVKNLTNPIVYKITKAYISMSTGVKELPYSGQKIEYKADVSSDSNLFHESDIVYSYYKYGAGAVYDPVTKTVEGTPVSVTPDEVMGVGYYLVKVSFKGNDNFYLQDCPDGLLIVRQAKTSFNTEALKVEYDGAAHNYDVDAAKVKLLGEVDGNVITSFDAEDFDALVKIMAYDKESGKYIESNPEFINAGSYNYTLEYAGDESYAAATLSVQLVIDKATFKGIVFEGMTETYKSNTKYHTSVEIPDAYSDAVVKYVYGTQISDTPFIFNKAGQYNVGIRVSMPNYVDFVAQALVSVAQAEIKGVFAPVEDVVYDGQTHNVTLKGLTIKDGKYYYEGEEATVTFSNTSADKAGEYAGKITIFVKSGNYAILTLDTNLIISPAEVEVDYSGLNGVDSNTNLSEIIGKYNDLAGTATGGYLKFTDADGNEVQLNENGTLAPGKYTATIIFGDRNYTTTQYAEFEVGAATSPVVWIIAGAGAGAVVLVGAAIGIFLGVKKRKSRL